MSDSAVAQSKAYSTPRTKSTRVDQAHDLLGNETVDDDTPWLALAGRDPNQVTQQLDRQTNELMSYVRQQSEEIDSRQAELNAKLALLDHELRKVRLQTVKDVGEDLLAAGASDSDESPGVKDESPGAKTDDPPATPTESRSAAGATSPGPDASFSKPAGGDSIPEARLPEFEDVEKVVAEIAGLKAEREIKTAPVAPSTTPSMGSVDGISAPPAAKDETSTTDSFSLLLDNRTNPEARISPTAADVDAVTSALDAEGLEPERRLLAERKVELDRRKVVLQRVQEETRAMHREALEMRLVTEQLWADLSDKVPADRLSQLHASLRARLDDHYKSMSQTLADRQTELNALHRQLQQKQEELREQSRKLQEWVESRHEEIKAQCAQQDTRELLLDRREHRLQDEFARWETQRQQYKQQLQGLIKKISLAGLGELSQ